MLPRLDPYPHRLEVQADLSFAVREGKTRLKRSLAEPPLQVQRALYLDDSVLDMAFLFLLNPTPGIFQGDVQTIRVNVGPRSRVHLTTPSATKIYAMPDWDARQTLAITLEEDSYLEYLPEPLIPFQGARLVQSTQVQQSLGSTLILGEVVLPGRVASGEDFAFHTLDRRVTVTGPAGQPTFHEASLLAPRTLSPLGRTVLSREFPVTGTLLMMTAGPQINGLYEALRRILAAADTKNGGPLWGLSRLAGSAGLVVKVLSRDAKTIKALFQEVVETARRYFLAGDIVPGISGPAVED